MLIIVGAVTVVAMAAVATATWLGGDGDAAGDAAPAEAQPAGDTAAATQDTLLLVRTGDDGRVADSVTLLAVDGDGRATVVLIPTGVLVDVPGVGLDRLGLAGQYGGSALVQASVENTLGIAVDHVATVDAEAFGSWLDPLGQLEIDVPDEVVAHGSDGARSVAFEPGPQRLGGARLAEYATFADGEADELDVIARQRRMLAAVLTAVDDPAARGTLTGEATPLDTAADAGWVDRLLARAASAHATGESRFVPLPVEAFGGAGPDGRATYRARDADLAELRDGALAGSVPDGAAGGAARVQVLNGVGVPGIGQEVERRLGGGSVRIVATDNARSFDEPVTRVIVYDDGDRAQQAARRVRERLGVGTIEVSRQPQSVVDVTIVVGADFAP